jgi:predicted NUDIX family phosphoesterase
VLNDESNEVGKVHLGVVVLIDVESTSLSTTDPSVQNLQWMSIRSLLGQRRYYENWSQLCIDAINSGRF